MWFKETGKKRKKDSILRPERRSPLPSHSRRDRHVSAEGRDIGKTRKEVKERLDSPKAF